MKKQPAAKAPQRKKTPSQAHRLRSLLDDAAAHEKARGTSGRVMLYLGPELHQRFKSFCDGRGVSMNRAAILAIESMMDELGT